MVAPKRPRRLAELGSEADVPADHSVGTFERIWALVISRKTKARERRAARQAAIKGSAGGSACDPAKVPPTKSGLRTKIGQEN